MKLSWRKWKLGCIVAFACALLTAGAGIDNGTTWVAFIREFCASAITVFGAFITQHPIQDITADTEIVKKDANEAHPV